MNNATYILLLLAGHIAPRHRRDWIDAMQVELEYAPSQNRLNFAAGCLLSALNERSIHMFRTGFDASKFICLSACFLLAAFAFANLIRFNQQDPVLGALFGLLVVAWGAAFVATALKMWRSLGQVAIGGIVLSVSQGLGILLDMPEVQQNHTLIWALFQEGLVLFGALFGAAQLFRRKQAAAPI